MKKILDNYHILILVLYISIVTILASYLQSPNLKSIGIVLLIGACPVIAMLFYTLKSNSAETLIFDPGILNRFFRVYDLIMIFLTLICFCSFGIGLIKNISLFESAFSYSLRLVTTALHPLYPLESRLFHTLIPFSLVTPFGKKSYKVVLWTLYVLLVFLLQIKIAPLYLFLIVLLALHQNSSKKLSSKAIICVMSLACCAGLYSFTYKNSNKDFEQLMKNDHLKSVMKPLAPAQAESRSLFQENCAQKKDMRLAKIAQFSNISKFAYDFTYRTVILPSIISRVFVCAWDNEYRGYFRGHQLARFFGEYTPVYNTLYVTYFPEHAGFSYANAVGNYVFDSYFQLGIIGVILATLITLSVLFLINKIPSLIEFRGLKNLMKINFIYGVLTASILSTTLFFLPLLCLYAITLYLKITNTAQEELENAQR